LKNTLLSMPRALKRLVALSVDIALCVVTVWFAYYLRLGDFISFSGNTLWAVAASICISVPIFVVSGLYRAIFRYSGWPALITVARAAGIYGLLYFTIFTVIGINDVPRTVGIIQPILLLFAIGASRAFARVWLGSDYRNILKKGTLAKVLVYGAGVTGRQLAAALANNREMEVVGFLDDDKQIQGHILNGLSIFSPQDLPSLVVSKGVRDVLLAMPSITRKRRNEILRQVQSAHVAVRTLPSLNDLAQGKISVSDLRDLDIDDLLGREPAIPDRSLLEINVRGKVVLVAGAGGSIGSEICRQLVTLEPSKLLLIEQSEFALYAIHKELEEAPDRHSVALVPLLASVQDDLRMRDIMSTWRPHIVYHAAAYKHVPLVEHNAAEGIKNNVLGTLRSAIAAAENGVSHFVLISTDKAVRPTNVMGASKRLAEMILQALAGEATGTTFSMVRFGNVLDSSGSVVPKFRKQIRDGGPVTLTHPEVIRYFMTISEASQLVIQSGAMASGGDVFVLDMGQPVKISELARRMIELSGLSVRDRDDSEGDIEIQVTGLRPGEKLFEELLIGNNPQPTPHPRIMRAHEAFIPWTELKPRIEALRTVLSKNNMHDIRAALQELVAGYEPSGEIVDWVHLERDA